MTRHMETCRVCSETNQLCDEGGRIMCDKAAPRPEPCHGSDAYDEDAAVCGCGHTFRQHGERAFGYPCYACGCQKFGEVAAPRPEARTGEARPLAAEVRRAAEAMQAAASQRERERVRASRREFNVALDTLADRLAAVSRERDEALESLADERVRGKFLNETIREHDRQNDEIFDRLRRELDEARRALEEAVKMLDGGWINAGAQTHSFGVARTNEVRAKLRAALAARPAETPEGR